MSVLRRERSAHTGRAHVGHVCAHGVGLTLVLGSVGVCFNPYVLTYERAVYVAG
jgi:hypothetical protein